jgi:hypothetical protein
MYPYSYTSLKIIHDQEIREALERKYSGAEQKTQRQGLSQMFGAFLARFNNQQNRKQEKPLSRYDWDVECSVDQCCAATR